MLVEGGSLSMMSVVVSTVCVGGGWLSIDDECCGKHCLLVEGGSLSMMSVVVSTVCVGGGWFSVDDECCGKHCLCWWRVVVYG